MRKRYLLSSIICVGILCTFFKGAMAQRHIQSLKDKIKNYTPACKVPCILDSAKVILLLDLAWQLNSSKTDTVLGLCQEGLALANKINYTEGVAQAYHVIANYYKGQSNNVDAIKYLFVELDTLDKWSKTTNNVKLVLSKKAACYNSLANAYKGLGNNLEAFNYFNNALSINEKYNNLEGAAINYKNVGDIYLSWGSLPKALSCYHKTLAIAQKLNKPIILAATLGSMGLIYRRQNNFDSAIVYYNQALEINTRQNDKRGIGINLGQLGASYKEKKDYTKSLANYNRALEAFTSVNFKAGVASIYNNIGEILLLQENNQSALQHFQNAYNTQMAIGRNSPMAHYLGNLGLAYVALNRNDEAENYLLKSAALFDTLQDYDGAKWVNEELSKFYLSNNRHNEALVNFKKSTAYKDSLFNEQMTQELTTLRLNKDFEAREAATKAALASEKQKAVAEVDKKRLREEVKAAEEKGKRIVAENEKNNVIIETSNRVKLSEAEKRVAVAETGKIRTNAESEAKQQRSLRNYILIIAGTILLASAIVFIFYKRKRDADHKQKELALHLKAAENEMKALRSQMNPHFIFNALQSIQSFLLTQKPGDANTYLLKFSKLMRLVLENSQNSEVPLEDDLQALELYMQLESIRLPHPFTYKVHIDETLIKQEIKIPPLVLQPFVENAIWHGLQHKGQPGHIDIYIEKRERTLYATVADNGVGRNGVSLQRKPILVKKESLGLKLTEERLKILNEMKNTTASFRIIDLVADDRSPAGTKVELIIPL